MEMVYTGGSGTSSWRLCIGVEVVHRSGGGRSVTSVGYTHVIVYAHRDDK